jgi:alkanesulfonate monooxygenase SsuD/methylene tetrahydromethanopterin reductase-like flavin-dependent oxidoreductase (luciferase family)
VSLQALKLEGISFYVVAQASGLDFGLWSLGYEEIAMIARKSEEVGYDGVVYCDHVFFKQFPYPETWTTLTALVMQTKRIKIGTHVACYNYHQPQLIAKMAATIDQISRGRFQFGIGACGWGQEVEHPTYGLQLLQPTERMKRLREAVIVIRKMLTEDKPSFNGEYYRINQAQLEPKPVQRPLPIWIGGSGSKLLQVAAEVADGWDTGFARPSDYDLMLSELEKGCERFGRSLESIQRGFSSYLSIIASDAQALESEKKRLLPAMLANKNRHHIPWVRDMPEQEYLERRFSMGGTVDELITKIDVLVKKGVKHFFLSFADFPSTSMLELFAEKVIPAFK